MQIRRIILVGLMIVLAFALSATGCIPVKPSQDNFKMPTVTLSQVEVASYWGWWYYSSQVEPTKGKADNRGAPLVLAFVFEITNPNEYPVVLDDFRFTVAFEDFDLNTVNAYESMWIPAGKTNELRVPAVFDARTSMMSLGVTGGFKLKEKNVSIFDQLESWWTGISAFSFPVYVKEGAAQFGADGVSAVVAFSGKFPE
ncbi:MAG: LEA type 2 family protein [Deltaproteobacteria bacterium]|nr:LEA type 2 family protein [Deltaproteobacteria bacterium]